MKFWDSSALVPLLVREPTTGALEGLLRRDPRLAYWWGSLVECAGALARREREGSLARATSRLGWQVLDHLLARASEIQPSPELRARAIRLVAVHQIRAADALQLAAALIWCRERPKGVGLVSLDNHLRLAAASEGFQVLPLSEEVHEPSLID